MPVERRQLLPGRRVIKANGPVVGYGQKPPVRGERDCQDADAGRRQQDVILGGDVPDGRPLAAAGPSERLAGRRGRQRPGAVRLAAGAHLPAILDPPDADPARDTGVDAVAAGGSEQPAVVEKADGRDRGVVAIAESLSRAAGRRPEPRRAVGAAGRDPAAVGTVGDGGDSIRVAG